MERRLHEEKEDLKSKYGNNCLENKVSDVTQEAVLDIAWGKILMSDLGTLWHLNMKALHSMKDQNMGLLE